MRKNVLLVGWKTKTPFHENGTPRTKILKFENGLNVHKLAFPHNTRTNTFSSDIMDYIEYAGSYIEKNDIDGVCHISDMGSLIGAVLCEKYGFSGPSILSVFYAYHKYFTRVQTHSTIPYRLFDITQPIPDDLTFPCYIKAPCSAFGVLGFTLENKEKLKRLLPLIQTELPKMNVPLIHFSKKYLPNEIATFLEKDTMLIEGYRNSKQITLEGFAYQGEIYPLFITDTNFLEGTRCIDNFSLPSSVTKKEASMIQHQMMRDISAIGLNNTFFNIEYWITDTGCELIEINARTAHCFKRLYKEVYGYDIIPSIAKLCLGIKPDLSNFVPRCQAIQCNIIAQKNGNSSDFFDYTQKSPAPTRFFIPPNSSVHSLGESKSVIGQFELFGESYRQIKKIADTYRNNALKKKPNRISSFITNFVVRQWWENRLLLKARAPDKPFEKFGKFFTNPNLLLWIVPGVRELMWNFIFKKKFKAPPKFGENDNPTSE